MTLGVNMFRKSPLLISVPLDGTDTVPGLVRLQQRRRQDVLEERLGIPKARAEQPVRRYKGPYLSQLSLDVIKQPPKPWPDFLVGSSAANNQMAYNLPSHTSMLMDRLEENLVFFLVNYLTIGAAFGLHVILQHPWSMAALLCVYLSECCAPGRPQTGAAGARAPQPGSGEGRAELGIHSLFAMASGVLFIMSGAIGALLRCVPLALAVVLGHAAFRRAATEDRAAGVDFRVLWRHGTQGAKQHEDPWRLFKELWFALLEAGVSTACTLWYSVASYLAVIGQAVWPQTWPVSVWPGLTGRLAGKMPAA